MNNEVSITVEQLKKAIDAKLTGALSASPASASDEQFYKAAALVVLEILAERRKAHMARSNASGQKQVYYLSIEYLVGKSLKNNLYNLGLQDVMEEALSSFDVKLDNLYKCEPDPGLGNGGLGRLAACYLDGLATDDYYATGYSILYEYGIFKQRISDGWQSELPDYWLPGGDVWLEAVPEIYRL